MDSSLGSLPANMGVDHGGSICGETVGAKSEGWGAFPTPGISKSVKTGRAGRLAEREAGCCLFSGDDGRAGRLAKCEVRGFSVLWEEECADIANFPRLTILASSSLTFDI